MLLDFFASHNFKIPKRLAKPRRLKLVPLATKKVLHVEKSGKVYREKWVEMRVYTHAVVRKKYRT